MFSSLPFPQCLAHSKCSRHICMQVSGLPRGDHGQNWYAPASPPSRQGAPGLTVFLIEQILDLLPQRVGNVDP